MYSFSSHTAGRQVTKLLHCHLPLLLNPGPFGDAQIQLPAPSSNLKVQAPRLLLPQTKPLLLEILNYSPSFTLKLDEAYLLGPHRSQGTGRSFRAQIWGWGQK